MLLLSGGDGNASLVKCSIGTTAKNLTMTTITIEQAGKYDGQEVTLKGWLYNLRESGKLLFPIFRDGTGIIQGVCALKENPEAFESLKGLTQESSVIVTGKIRAEKRAPGGYEIGVTKIQIVQKVSESTPFPIQLKEHGVDFLLDQRHLWIRTPRQAAILRIRAEAIRAAREFMDGQGYTLTDAPMFTPAACEGTSTLFEVNYIDDQKAYLTQSGQLYAEAIAMALGKVYTFGPTFRAEKSKTRRHLTEFWMLEPEAAYVEFEEAMSLGEGLVSAIVQGVLKNKSRELELLKREHGRRTAVTDRVMVCLSSNPEGSDELLRKAARTAARLNADWYAVHVETPAESVQKISTGDFRALLDNVNLAADLGAEVVWLKSPDVTKALLDFAHEHNMSRIIVGRTRPGLLRRILRRSVTERLVYEARDFDVEIVGRDESAEC